MEIKKYAHENLREAVEALETFVFDQQQRAGGSTFDFEGRDIAFLKKARHAIEEGTELGLREIVIEMRGLSHYFCSYAKDTKTLEKLLNDLTVSLDDAISS